MAADFNSRPRQRQGLDQVDLIRDSEIFVAVLSASIGLKRDKIHS